PRQHDQLPCSLVKKDLNPRLAALGADRLNDRNIRVSSRFTDHDEMTIPDLEAKGVLERIVAVIHAQGDNEIGCCLPGNFDLDDGFFGNAEVAKERRAWAIGEDLAGFVT